MKSESITVYRGGASSSSMAERAHLFRETRDGLDGAEVVEMKPEVLLARL